MARNSYQASDERGLDDFGPSAYFIDKSWIDGLNDID